MYGSTNYSWSVADIPEGIIVQGIEHKPIGYGIGPVIQNFYFGVIACKQINVDIHFVLSCMSGPTDIVDQFTANVRIVPSNAKEFVSHNENASKILIANRMLCSNQVLEKYGYPCTVNANYIYGYPCGVEDATVKYGYPCAANPADNYSYRNGAEDAVLKYGYPCTANANNKYGYPCGVVDAGVKYTYPGC